MNEKTPSQEQLKELYSLAGKFEQLKCWECMEDSDIFGVINPENGETGYACVLGNAEQAYGINIYLGPKGIAGYLKLLNGEIYEGNNLFATQYCLSLTFEPDSFLDDKDIRTIHESGLIWKNKEMLPIFRSYIPGYYPWHLTEEEVRFFTTYLQQSIEVCKRFKKNSELFTTSEPNTYFVRVPLNSNNVLVWHDEFIKAKLFNEEEEPVYVNELKIKRILKKFPQRVGIWELGCEFFPISINNKKSRPFMPLSFLCVDGSTGEILAQNLSEMRKRQLIVGEEILGLIEKRNIIPEVIFVNNKILVKILDPLIKVLEIPIKFEKIMPFYNEAENAMIGFFDKR